MNTGPEIIQIDISPNDMLQKLKEVIQSSKGIPMMQYQLVSNNHPLDDYKTLIQNGLTNGAIINLVPISYGPIGINICVFDTTIM